MKLYCACCKTTHEFTPGEVERIVYTLQAIHADALCHAAGLPWDQLPEDALDCLEGVASQGYDSECYQEWTQQFVECRRAAIARAEA